MSPATRPTTVVGPVPVVKDGIVSRCALFKRLGRAGRITPASTPAGSGKAFLLRSWIDAASLELRTPWASVRGEERDPQRFWVSVLDPLRQTAPDSALVREPDVTLYGIERLDPPEQEFLIRGGVFNSVENTLGELDAVGEIAAGLVVDRVDVERPGTQLRAQRVDE